MLPPDVRRTIFRRTFIHPGRRFVTVGVVAIAMLTLVHAAKVDEITTEHIPLPLGDTTIDLVVHRSEKAGLTYVNLHDDENTAVEAALAILRTHGGVLFELRHEGVRNLTFQIDQSAFIVDPNRIFTDHGIELTLARHGSASPDAHAAVRAFSDSLLSAIEFSAMNFVVTIHNNTNERYSSRSYAEDGDLAVDARSVHLASDFDHDDFYFVTTEALFESLKAHGGNVVLQDNAQATDDGSLSIRAGRHGIPYVNVEAQHGHVDVQREMLEVLHQVLLQDADPR